MPMYSIVVLRIIVCASSPSLRVGGVDYCYLIINGPCLVVCCVENVSSLSLSHSVLLRGWGGGYHSMRQSWRVRWGIRQWSSVGGEPNGTTHHHWSTLTGARPPRWHLPHPTTFLTTTPDAICLMLYAWCYTPDATYLLLRTWYSLHLVLYA